MRTNPLASSTTKAPAAPEHPLQRHAEMWKHVNSMPVDALISSVALLDYALPIQGALANDPKVTAKDVIKAWAGAAADGKIDPSKAVAAISEMPADPDKLKPWLKKRYADSLTMAVHAKAALQQQAQQQAAPQPVASPQPAGVPVQPMPQPAQPGAPA